MSLDQLDAPASAEGVTTPPSPGATEIQDVQSPLSSSGETGAAKQDLLSVVMDVAPPKAEEGVVLPGQGSEEAAATEADKPEGEAANADTQSGEADPTDDELKAYTPNAQKRIRALVAQRNEVRTEIESLRPQAEGFQAIQSYLTDYQISNDDYATLLGLGASLRTGKYQEFLDGLEPYLQVARLATGQFLPPDLQEQVDQGLVPEDVARRLSVETFQRHQLAQQVQDTQAARSRDTQASTARAVQGAVSEWESRVRSSDPDYAAKQVAVERFTRALISEKGLPKNPQEALAYVQEAYGQVNATFGNTRPPVTATAPKPNVSQSPAVSVAAPKTLMEAALQGLAQSRS